MPLVLPSVLSRFSYPTRGCLKTKRVVSRICVCVLQRISGAALGLSVSPNTVRNRWLFLDIHEQVFVILGVLRSSMPSKCALPAHGRRSPEGTDW